MSQIFLKKPKQLLPIFVFFFFLLIYLATNGGHIDNGDGPRAFLYAENLALNGKGGFSLDTPSAKLVNVAIDSRINAVASAYYDKNQDKLVDFSKGKFMEKFVNENKSEFYDHTYLGTSTVASIPYLISVSFGLNPLYFVPLVTNSVIIAASVTVLFLIGRTLYSDKIGFILALIFGVCSFIWPYTNSLFSRPLATLFLLSCIYFILSKKNNNNVFPFLAGISFGLSFIAHPLFVILTPGVLIFGIYKFYNKKRKIIFLILGLLAMILLLFYLNHYRFGSVDDFGFPQGKSTITDNKLLKGIRSYEGFYGLLISPGKGLLIYLPVFVLYPISLYYLFKKDKSLALLSIFIFIMMFYYIAEAPIWNKLGSIWGSHRFLIPIIPFVIFPIGSLLEKFPRSLKIKIPLIILSTFGFAVNLLGNLVYISQAYRYGVEVEKVRQMGVRNDIFTWNPAYSPISEIIKILQSNWLEQRTGCSVDVGLYCAFGLLPIIIIVILLAILGFIIVRTLNKTENPKLE